MPLQYPLLFLHGESGWSPDMHLRVAPSNKDTKLSINMYYSYLLHDRFNVYTLLLNGGRLFQQFVVDAYVCIEQSRLDYYRKNQNTFRNEFLQGIHDAIQQGDLEGQSIGKRMILPSSFVGGPRYMYKHYLDALAICRVHGNPQYFITFTCNVKWPEIQRYMSKYPSLRPEDRPDSIARVFQIKAKSLIAFLKTKRPFGEVAADLYTIEFQKRGLPHCHLLFWVTEACKIRSAAEVDNYISAEIPDPEREPDLYMVVSDLMIHGPCGLVRPDSPCMSDGSCSKKYVVPYNQTLSLHFMAHINVEYCGWSLLIKYLFKYISKGADRIRYKVHKAVNAPDDTQNAQPYIDEIQNFVDGRFICPHEASWRILNFPIHYRNPLVQVLSVHLENMQNVTFKDNDQLDNVLENSYAKQTTLTEWLRNNQIDATGRHLRYVDYLLQDKWDLSAKVWIQRASNKTPAIGRLIYVHPSSGERFFLRMLLNHQRGCQSFKSIKTVHGDPVQRTVLHVKSWAYLKTIKNGPMHSMRLQYGPLPPNCTHYSPICFCTVTYQIP
ncbi:uncharacterized protein LOC110944528 [Helianthus annuus]|uniref:uncharacterized protein LOC110944528 n=1 Tax=Helianthus annuus TaxID=4232 RepID=UPI000B905294|nr:uncharacterized protein LOC110944528 [Helianthus annuus]